MTSMTPEIRLLVADIVGVIAGFITTCAAIPQIFITIKSGETRGISYPFLVTLSTGLTLWLFYGILVQDILLIVFNSFSLFLYAILITYKLKVEKCSRKPEPPRVAAQVYTPMLNLKNPA